MKVCDIFPLHERFEACALPDELAGGLPCVAPEVAGQMGLVGVACLERQDRQFGRRPCPERVAHELETRQGGELLGPTVRHASHPALQLPPGTALLMGYLPVSQRLCPTRQGGERPRRGDGCSGWEWT